MIARMTLTMGERRIHASLLDDGQWTCPEDLLVHTFLNQVFAVTPEAGGALHPPTHTIANKAANAVRDAGWAVDLQFIQAEHNAA